MRKVKKMFIIAIIAVLTILGISNLNIVRAESAGPIYLGIVALRASGYAYQSPAGKTVWKIAQYDNTEDETPDLSKQIYCLKDGVGFGSDTYTNIKKAYSQKFNLKDLENIIEPYKSVLPTGENYNKLMWILDNMYTDIGLDDKEKRIEYFCQLSGKSYDEWNSLYGEYYDYLTDDDIDVIQQLAIWNFTNTDEQRNFAIQISSIKSVADNYIPLADIIDENGERGTRAEAAEAFYNLLINGADENYVTTNNTTAPIELVKNNATMTTIGENYIAGPYTINQLLNVNYSIAATYKNHGTETTITPTLGVKDSNGNIIATTKTLKELVGTEFYLMMPTSSDIAGIDMEIDSSYSSRTATYWSMENAPSTDQPVVMVEETPHNFSTATSIVVVNEKPFDLSLRKFITTVNGIAVTSREPQVDTSALAAGTATTATYNHSKDPIKVEIGDVITYTIRVYNEGEVDGYVTEITDHLPAQLEFLPEDADNIKYMWRLNTDGTVSTKYLAADNEVTTGENIIKAYDGGQTLNYKDVQIKCKVKDTTVMPTKITNIADITGFTDSDGNTVTDRDSQENNVNVPTGTELENYKDQEIARGEEYIPGEQDDDNFEKLVLQPKVFDLSLRKFITEINDKDITSRIPEVDTSKLNTIDADGKTITTATYNHSKEPVAISIGDKVIYTIRVYNEGTIDGYATEITDHLPEQLKFLENDEINKQYGWIVDENDSQIITTNYLSKDNELNTGDNLLKAFDETTLSYKEVKVACQVIETDPIVKKITNIADITETTDSNGDSINDRDSDEDNVKIPDDLSKYKDDEINKDYVPGQEDDDDFEKIIIKEFDLSLRKFITAVNNTEIKNRYPVFSIDSNGNYVYTHTKEPVLVSNSNVVTYTIRVYNEGDINGYASLVKDDIPEGLKFLPDNTINTEYRWVMLDKEGNETTNVDNAVSIVTDYLSKDQEKTDKANLLKAFNPDTMQEPDYKDVKVAFEVSELNTSDRIVINQAQIADDSDEDGNEVTDKDSTPDEWNDGEDDQDIEKVKVQYFDLALRKWVTQAIVIESDGTTTVTETGHTAEDDPEGVVKVDLKKKKLNSVTVKFRYSIRVTNEGQIAGYVKEIKDYIPEGLKFIAEDNPTWTEVDDNTITTDERKDVLLQPGESTEVEVLLTWINSEDNLGLKTNIAEISKDYNEYNSPDIDSTPDNKKDGEDDIDDAPVILSIQTGQAQRYILITGGVLLILVGGILFVKRITR